MKRVFSIILLLLYLGAEETTLWKPPFKHCWGINKGTEAKLDMLTGDATDFDNPQGLACTRLDATNEKGVDDDDELTVYGVNSGRGEIIFNKSMTALSIYGKSGSGKGEFLNPNGISASRKGWVVVADTDNRRVVLLENPGDRLKWVRTMGEDILIKPMDVAISPLDTIFVTDASTNSIHLFDIMGRHLAEIAKGELAGPTGIDIDNAHFKKSRYRESLIFVIDAMGKRITKMDYRGRIKKRRALSEIGFGNGIAKYLALDYDNNIYFPDTVGCKIVKLDKDLNFITATGKCGRDGELEFNHPRGIAIWRRFGQVFISERDAAQYYWLAVDIDDFNISFQNDSLTRQVNVEFDLTQKAYFTIDITAPDGTVWNMLTRRRFQQEEDTWVWDLKDNQGNPVPLGEYKIDVLIEPTYSSFTFFDIKRSGKVKITPPVR